ncbi:hypothetical protein FE257_002516 [Aspergillus nanangensis]|uniref:Major facilitator superfamily (MFS) profile domain-containing protein n=1 Tax=Aspergillus nanangensis TaxID=2582783 RepID=A0AAD4CSX6_ASPNN|nr:hypothetical protein FE257_002516 [Aspergillus nanangensis]
MNGIARAGTEAIRHHRNPLRERTPEELEDDVTKFHHRNQLEDAVDVALLIKGARIAQDPRNLSVCQLTSAEKKAIETERKLGFFQQTKDLKVTILTTACAAIIQGWQQSSINASSAGGWQRELLPQDWELSTLRWAAGVIDAAPWLSGSILFHSGTWLSDPLQEGRYGSARCESWQALLVCRIILGVGIGAKASIAPVFAAEAAVDHLRGRLLMMWQVFDTFGIFVGFACVWIVDRHWRVLLGTAAIPALLLLVLVFLCPESPRFLIRRGDYVGAFKSLRSLRGTDIQAARDLYYIHSQLQMETELLQGQEPENWWRAELYQEEIRSQRFYQRVWALFSLPRNRRACLAAFVVMISQQLCGINVLSFYSSTLFNTATCPDAGPSIGAQSHDPLTCNNPLANPKVAWLNFGFGLANFLFTIPAYFFIDWRGRRILLLISLGGMLVLLAIISGLFLIPQEHHDARIGLISTFTIVLFTAAYGIGAGPVPFTFSAEVFPLAFRGKVPPRCKVGMSFSVMVNFLGLGLLVLFVPVLTQAFEPDGQSKLLFLFTGLNALAFVLVFFLVPSGTARVSLEDMNDIFNRKTSEHVSEHLSGLKKLACRRPVDDEPEYPMRVARSPV